MSEMRQGMDRLKSPASSPEGEGGPRFGPGKGWTPLFIYAGSTRTAENFNSGILPNGSKAELVRILAAASS